MAHFDLTDSSAVVVIGSGAGGGTLSNELAQKGVKVVCLEAGPRLSLADIVNDERAMFKKMSWLDPRKGTGQLHPQFPSWSCKTVGGTTMHWEGQCPRLQEHELMAQTTYGEVADTSFIDWPLGMQELSSFYAKAEDKMGVAGTNGRPFLPGNNNYKVMAAGARKIGYQDVDTQHMAINSTVRDNRPSCQQIGFCNSGCAIGAKWSTLYTEVPKAEATGNFELRAESMVVRIHHDAHGRVTGVDYYDKGGVLRHQKARAVCVAGNAIETARLLLNSHSDLFPGGLANSSNQVGRNYMTHFTICVISLMPKPVNFHRGTQMAGVVRDEMRHDLSRGFWGGYSINPVPFPPEFLAAHMQHGGWGEELTASLLQYDHLAGLMMMGEDPPQATNRIILDPEVTDPRGMPIPVVHYSDHPNTTKMKAHALRQGKAIHSALGATKSYEITSLPATHNLGTARMSERANDGVCNKWGQTHDIKNLFVSDGSLFSTSGCANPTLTIVALAIRQAEFIKSEIEKGNI